MACSRFETTGQPSVTSTVATENDNEIMNHAGLVQRQTRVNPLTTETPSFCRSRQVLNRTTATRIFEFATR